MHPVVLSSSGGLAPTQYLDSNHFTKTTPGVRTAGSQPTNEPLVHYPSTSAQPSRLSAVHSPQSTAHSESVLLLLLHHHPSLSLFTCSLQTGRRDTRIQRGETGNRPDNTHTIHHTLLLLLLLLLICLVCVSLSLSIDACMRPTSSSPSISYLSSYSPSSPTPHHSLPCLTSA